MIEDFLIYDGTDIKNCLKKLDKAATGVLFVVDNTKRLIGAISDGDIRRAILNGVELGSSVKSLYNKDPLYIMENYLESDVRSIFLNERIDVVPIVDKSMKVKSILDWETFFGEKVSRERPILDIPVVIMAGGKGTRMAPFTSVLPKPLIPIGDKTILEMIIDEFRVYQINDYYFTLNYKGPMIEAYFNCLEKEYNVTNLWENTFEGTAGSLKLLPLENIKDNFILSNCDVIVKAEYDKALQHHKEMGALITVLSSIQHYKIPYGVIDFEKDGKVTGLIEKPEYTFSINTGVYIVNKEAIKYIPEGQVFHMTHLMEALIEKGLKVVTYPVNENDYIDIGQWKEYRSAIERMGIS